LKLTESGTKLKKIKVYWSIEGQNAQIQNQGLTIEVGMDAIELIVKIKIAFWGLKWTKDELRTNLKVDVFWCHFYLNETTCFVQKKHRFMLKKEEKRWKIESKERRRGSLKHGGIWEEKKQGTMGERKLGE